MCTMSRAGGNLHYNSWADFPWWPSMLFLLGMHMQLLMTFSVEIVSVQCCSWPTADSAVLLVKYLFISVILRITHFYAVSGLPHSASHTPSGVQETRFLVLDSDLKTFCGTHVQVMFCIQCPPPVHLFLSHSIRQWYWCTQNALCIS